jgi:hypothetical protein
MLLYFCTLSGWAGIVDGRDLAEIVVRRSTG